MRVVPFILPLLLLAACASTPSRTEGPGAMRENFKESLTVRLAEAEVALTKFDTAGALAIVAEIEKATAKWEGLSRAEDVAWGWLESRANEIQFIAYLFGVDDHTEDLKKLFATDGDRLFDRFAGDGTTTSSAACWQLYAISGRGKDAQRGFDRMLALLEGGAHAVKRLRLHMLAASTLAGMGMLDDAKPHFDAADAMLKQSAEKFDDLPAFGSRCALAVMLPARDNDFAAATAAMDERFKGVAEHLAKPRLARYLPALKELVESWTAEQAAYAKEPADLPRVEIETDKGKIEVVLYEDDAPNTVASFINLTEQGFYDGTPFHRVVPHFVVQGGDPKGTGEGGPGYSIKLEATRKHFRGSLGMARGADKDSAGSQFYFCLSALTTFHLNQGYAVFGRVTKGLEVMDQLRLGGKIIKARVLSKRAHEYKVEKLPEKKD